MSNLKKIAKSSYKDLFKFRGNAVVIIDVGWDEFFQIQTFNTNGTFTIKGRKRSVTLSKVTYPVAHLFPLGKGWFEKDGMITPMFKYDPTKIRTDIPKGNTLDKDVTKAKNLESINLTGHIMQDGKSKQGGFIVDDLVSRVLVRLKNGDFKEYAKSGLERVRAHKTKSGKLMTWFRWDESNKNKKKKEPIRVKKSPVKRYENLYKQYDPLYQYTDDPRVRMRQSDIESELTELWNEIPQRDRDRLKDFRKKK